MSRTGALQIAMTAAGLALGGSIAQAQQVGTASAVNPAATANLKTITIGQSIAHKERIQTRANGSVQLLFLDKTSMTIGPNSDLTIDEYVYDPRANSGKLAATLSKGALRFVGGQISHNGDAEIKTASALIGIRGGVMMTDGRGGIYSGYGTSTVTSGGQSVTLGAGEFTQTQSGGPPTAPGLPPPGFVRQQIAIFQSNAGQNGGAGAGAASQRNIAAAEDRATGSPGGSVTGTDVPLAPLTIVGQIRAITTSLAQSVQISNQSTALQQSTHDQSQVNAPPPPANNPPPPADSAPPVVNTPPPVANAPPPPASDPVPPASTPPPPANNPGPPDGNPSPPPRTVRPSVKLTGYVGGFDIITNRHTVITKPVSGKLQINLDAANNRVQANLATHVPNSVNPFTHFADTVRGFFKFGASGSTGPANSTYADYDNFGAVSADSTSDTHHHQERWHRNRHSPPYVGEIATLSNDATKAIGTSSGVPSLTVCQCDYTRWGFWTVQQNSYHQTETTVGTWVAGRPAGSISDVPLSGQATYVGHVLANVQDHGALSVAAGNFSNTVDFGARSGAVTVTHLDSTNYAGNVSFNTDPRNFGGTLAGNVGNRSMALQGSFFQGAHSPVGEMGGSVAITGANNYLGSGIFAASKR